MSKDEFFAFMPLLIYGIAVTELVMHWRDYLKKERRYWPHLLTGIILLELAFLNFYFLYDELDELFNSYPNFLFRLTSPLILLLAVSVYTPEAERDVKEYFDDKISLIYGLLAAFIVINMLSDLGYNLINLIRLIAIVICLLIAITRIKWLIFLWIVLRLSLFYIEEYLSFLI